MDYKPVLSDKRSVDLPSPYLDLASTSIPVDIKKLFKIIRYYFAFDSVISPILVKMAEYPVTDIIFIEDNRKMKERYEKVFLRSLRLHSFIIEAMLDRMCYGSCFVSIHYPFKRFLVCPKCKKSTPIDELKVTVRDHKFAAKCPEKGCSYDGVMKIEDNACRNIDEINLIRWPPETIDIYCNPISGERTYWYTIPEEDKKDFVNGKPEMIRSIPEVFINAIKEGKKVKFRTNNIYHFRGYSLSEKNMAWPKPMILPALKDAWLLQVVRKNTEMICTEGIIPLDILFPEATGDISPHSFLNLRQWRSKLEEEISKWRRDKQYIPIMPIPVGWKRILGNQDLGGSVSMVRELTRLICGAVGLPQEFIYGGISYSGSNISLRVVENHFICDRDDMYGLAEFIIDNVCNFLSIPIPSFRFADFKMADDIQKRAQVDQLNQRLKVSDQTLLAEFGWDSEKERDTIIQEAENEMEIHRKKIIRQAQIEGEVQKIQTRNQIENQKMMQGGMGGYPGMIPQEGSPGQSAPTGESSSPQLPAQSGEGQHPMNPGQPVEGETANMEILPEEVAKSYARQISKMDPIQAELMIQKLQHSIPSLAGLVHQHMQKGSGGGTDMRPLPQDRPPRRSSSPV